MNVAVITGAASGIGLALTQVHLRKGNKVVLVDNNQSKLNTLAQELSAEFPEQVLDIACDVSNSEQVHRMAQEIQSQTNRIDWLYNNAGVIGPLGPIWALPIERIREAMDINLYGMLHLIQAFSPYLFQQNHRSHLINMASMYALCSGSQIGAYSMSKHAVLALSESLYFDFKRLNKPVNVSVVFPSFTDTSLLCAPSEKMSPFQISLNKLLARSRPALDVAEHIALKVEQNCFYILPDKEVKAYAEDRNKAIVLQEKPHRSNIEKLMNSLMDKLGSAKIDPVPKNPTSF